MYDCYLLISLLQRSYQHRHTTHFNPTNNAKLGWTRVVAIHLLISHLSSDPLRNAEYENRNLQTQESQHSPRVMGSGNRLHKKS